MNEENKMDVDSSYPMAYREPGKNWLASNIKRLESLIYDMKKLHEEMPGNLSPEADRCLWEMINCLIARRVG